MRYLNKRWWPHRLITRLDEETCNKAYVWCRDSFPGKDRWRLASPNTWYFKNEKDVTMFLLRWS